MEGGEFDWDDGNLLHLARHGVSPIEAEKAILDPMAVMLEIQSDEEERIKAVGQTGGGRILAVLFTFRGDAIRPITAFDATGRDRDVYLKGKGL